MDTVLICLIVCSVYSLIIYKILSVRIKNKIDNKTFLKEVREEINSLVTQINETSDRNVLLIENRLERLSNLISISDKTIVELKQGISKQKNNFKSEVLEEVITKKSITIDEVVSDDSEQIHENKPNYLKDDESLTRRERIILLHKQGISPTIIASQTKATIGEVELTISLNRG